MKYFIPFLFVMLVGCDAETMKQSRQSRERMQLENNQQQYRLQKLAYKNKRLAQERRLQHQTEQAEAERTHKKSMTKLFHSLLIMALAFLIFGLLVFAWESFQTWLKKQKLVQEFRIREVEEEQKTLRLKHTQLLEHVFKNLEKLGTEERKIVLQGISSDQYTGTPATSNPGRSYADYMIKRLSMNGKPGGSHSKSDFSNVF